MKRCTGCGVMRPLDQFFGNVSSPDGRRSRCKDCTLAKLYNVCPRCGTRKWHNSAHCRSCSHDLAAGRYTTETPSPSAGRRRARKLYTLGMCQYEGCTQPAYDRHHVDGDPTNNAPSNIELYCRTHHMVVDGRLKMLQAMGGRTAKGPETRKRMSAARKAWHQKNKMTQTRDEAGKFTKKGSS